MFERLLFFLASAPLWTKGSEKRPRIMLLLSNNSLLNGWIYGIISVRAALV
jgi:hypothetical protein